MSQELGITEKSPDFTNPYRTERDDVSEVHTCWASGFILAKLSEKVCHALSLTRPLGMCVSRTFLICLRCFTLPKLLRRSWGRRRKRGGKKRRGKKSGKALASLAPDPNYSTVISVCAETKRMEHTHSCRAVARRVDSKVQKAKCSVGNEETSKWCKTREVEVDRSLNRCTMVGLIEKS